MYQVTVGALLLVIIAAALFLFRNSNFMSLSRRSANTDLSPFGRVKALLKERAHANGLRNYPSTETLHPDAFEDEIREAAYAEYNLRVKPVSMQLASLERRTEDAIVKAEALPTAIRALKEIGYVNTLLIALRAQMKRPLVEVISKHLRAEQFVRIYKSANPPVAYRDALPEKSKLDMLASVVAVLIGETFANSYFYSHGVGLVAGAAVAFAFSVIVAAIGFFTGFLFRHKNDVRASQRLFGVFILLIGTTVAIFISSLTATFRAQVEIALERNPEQTSIPFASLFNSAISLAPSIFLLHIPFAELNATLLFGFAMIAFVNAAYAGYKSSDPYPGYAAVAKAATVALNERNLFEKDLIAGIALQCDLAKRERERILSEMQYASNEQTELGQRLKGSIATFDATAASVSKEFELLVRSYRDLNAHIRTSAPPLFFSSPPAPLELDQQLALTANLGASISRLGVVVSELANHQDAIRSDLSQIDILLAHSASSDTPSFLQGCHDDAVAALSKQNPSSGPVASLSL